VRDLKRGEPTMPMRGELTIPAMRTGSKNAVISRKIISDFWDSDLLVVIIFALIGLFLTIMLTLLLPLSADIAGAFAQLS
jgi:hypothetical protein